jgi:hypothetical protein
LRSSILFLLSALPLTAAVDFDRDIRPILSDNCFTCHGPDEKRRMANLRLDQKEGGAFRVITPGDSSHSKLYERVSTDKKGLRMPPASAPALTPKQIAVLKEWIDGGAKWDAHWAYIAPVRQEPPAVSVKSWNASPIDRFLLARLEKDGLSASPEADRATLLRRLSLDLTGIPPTLPELDSFRTDKSTNAYEKQVDRLLASSRYGERMAMQWLDLARYADTHGYHIDSHRDMWHWRDWVIQSFNRNQPFDQFTIEQLAGDMLPNATTEQKLATGFNRNHMINFEGGAIPEEYQTEYVIDRLETTSNVWMGTTMGCARCHDHKYDPIKQKEFYQFYAIFNNIAEKGLDGRKGNAEPLMQLPTAAQASRLVEARRELEARTLILDEKTVHAAQTTWEQNALESLPKSSRAGLLAHYDFDGGLTDSSGNELDGRFLLGDLTYPVGIIGKTGDFDGQVHAQLGSFRKLDGTTPFSLAFFVRTNDREPMAVLQKLDPTTHAGIQIAFDEAIPIGNLMRGAKLSVRLSGPTPTGALEIQTVRRLPTSSKDSEAGKPWYHVTVNYDGAGGLKLYLNGTLETVNVITAKLTGPFGNNAPLEIGNKTLGKPFKGQLDDLRVYDHVLPDSEIQTLARHQPARAVLAVAPAKRTKEQSARLRDYFLVNAAAEPFHTAWNDTKRLKTEIADLNDAIPTSMVMAEMPKPRETAILGRGDYQNRGELVTAGVPAMLPPLPPGEPANRLTLARWLVSGSHPLTARVTVNRYWQMYFGTGLVKTSEDFGSQGEPPSNPALLDWLATEFVRTDWNVKGMQKLLVMSQAYRQSSKVTPELLERDPENRLLARGPRFRLPAETVRDNALAVSGLLKERTGGPSVFPYQPAGLWEDTAFGDVYSAQSYSPSHGDDLYRRSMYTFWKRTSGPPDLITFDAPDREKCTGRRGLTNTPLQALVLLNDPTYVESARSLAQRMLLEAGGDRDHDLTGKRIRLGFRLATARMPSTEEVQVLRDLQERSFSDFHRHPENAGKLLRVGESAFNSKLDAEELAAWTTVASTILNLDETITKE